MFHTLKPFHCPNCNVLFTNRDIGRQCTQRFPVILPCNHAVCDSCLYAAVKGKSKFCCPICKIPVDLSSGNESIAKLCPDIHAIGILNAHKKSPLPSLKIRMVSCSQSPKSKGLQNSALKVCDNCSQVEALWQCDECQSNFCNICFDEVHKKKNKKKHEVKKIFAELYNTMVQKGCLQHKNKTVEFYCEKDEQLTCSHCMLIGDHIGHEVKTLVDKNKSCSDNLKNILTDVSQIERRLKYTEHLLSEISSEEKIDVSEYIKNVHNHFHNLHSQLQARETELVSKLEEIANRQNEPFEQMVFEVSGYQKEIASIKRDAESVIENPCLAISAPFLLKKLESFKSIPCFLQPLQVNGDEKNAKIDLHLSDELEAGIKNHGSLEFTVKPRFTLVSAEELPENFCIDIPDSFAPSEDDNQSCTTADTFSEDSLMVSVDKKSSNIAAAFKNRDTDRMHPETVRVSYIKDPSCFWVQSCSNLKKFRAVSDGINRHCRSQEASTKKSISLERGDLYLVQFSADKKWYRGRVKRILEPGDSYEVHNSRTKLSPASEKKIVQNNELKVEIYYIDYGNSEILSVSKLQNIQPRFMHFPALARQCCLVDCTPVDQKEWSIEAIKSFSKFVNEKEVIMQIYEERHNVLYVDLSESPDASISNDVPVSVRDALVFQELALFPSGRNLSTRYCKSAQTFLPPERLRANADIAVIVSHVDSPSHFYVQQISTASYLSALIYEMSEAYSYENNLLLYNIHAPQVGMICAARFSVDKQWYRAQIKSLPGGANVEVQYVDFGNSEIIHHKFIRKLSDKFRKLNIQAIPCKLDDVTYNQDKSWSTQAKEWLTTKVSKKQLTLKSTGFDPAENKSSVTLYYIEDEYEVCVNALLVEAGLSSSSGPRSSEVRRKIDLPDPIVLEKGLERALSYDSVEESEPIPPPSVAKKSKPKPPTLVKKFPETEGHHMEVHVIHIVNPSVFYIRIAGDTETKFQKLMTDLQKTYTDFESKITDCAIGKSYAVFSDIRKQWLRGTVLSVSDDKKVKVKFVDYGMEEEVPLKNVQILLDIFTADEEYSICCELIGIIPAGGNPDWSYAACDAFHDLVAPHEILHISIKSDILKEANMNTEILPVSLFIEEIKLGGALEPTEVVFKNIATELVNLGLALPVRVNPTTLDNTKSVEDSERKESSDAVADKTVSPVTSLKQESPQKIHPDRSQVSLPEELEPPSEPEYRWKPAVHPQDPKFKGFVTNIAEDGSIQLHAMQKASSVVEMIKKALQFKYSKSTVSTTTNLKLPIGAACIAKFSVDSLWYRAEVLAVYPGKVKVNFVDYGNNEIVSLADIRTDIIMHTFPKQCFDCVITGIHAGNPGQWDTDLLNFLHSQLVETIVEVEPLGPPDKDGKLPCNVVTNCGISIKELLQSMGFVESDSEFCHVDKSFQPATELREGDVFPVCITQINTPNIVYLQRLKIPEPKSDSEKEYNKEHNAFLKLIKELQDKAESFPKIDDPMPGMVCCAKYSYDNNWYRCEITDLEENGAVVLYVDYGNSELTSFDNLRMPTSQIIDFPVQLYFCQISGMSPVGDDWDPEVKKFLVKKLLDSGLEIYAKVIVPGKISQIDLMVKNEEGEMKLAYEELLDMNLIVLQRN